MHASESRPPTSFSAFLYHPQAEKEAAKEAERAAKEAEKAAAAAAKEAAKEAERAAREEEKAAKAAEKERLKVRGCCGCFSLCDLVGLCLLARNGWIGADAGAQLLVAGHAVHLLG